MIEEKRKEDDIWEELEQNYISPDEEDVIFNAIRDKNQVDRSLRKYLPFTVKNRSAMSMTKMNGPPDKVWLQPEFN